MAELDKHVHDEAAAMAAMADYTKDGTDENLDDGLSDEGAKLPPKGPTSSSSLGSIYPEPVDPAAGRVGNGSVLLATPTKERHSLTLDQRRALRRWANNQVVRPSHKACIEWFETQYGLSISQSTVSHSLSPKYARLDGDSQLSGSRLRFGNWPDVEKLVLLWHSEMVNRGRHPTNDELVQKATAIFEQLPRYKGEKSPNFSPGWVHRFKKRYGLLMRRQRRTAPGPNGLGSAGSDVEDLPYLIDALPRLMAVSADTSPATIRETFQRIIGIDASLNACARARDDLLRAQAAPPPHQQQQQPPHMAIAAAAVAAANPAGAGGGVGSEDVVVNGGAGHGQSQPPPPSQMDLNEDDAEVALQNALRQIQQEEAEAEAEAAADRERLEQGLPPMRSSVGGANGDAAGIGSAYGQQQPSPQQQQQHHQQPSPHTHHQPLGTPTSSRMHPPTTSHFRHDEELKLTPIPSTGPSTLSTERAVRCPFCVNTRMLRSIKEAVEHMSTHVIV